MATRRNNKRKLAFNPNVARQYLEKGQQSNGSSYIKMPENIQWFKPEYKEGKTTAIYYLNVVPFLACKYNKEANEGDIWFRSKFRRAKVGSDNQSIVSPSTFGKPCPVSKLYARYKDDPNISDKELDVLKVKDRELYYVIDCKEKTKNGKPQVRLMDFSYYLFGEKLDTELYSEEYEEENYNALMFADIYEGRTLKITFKQKTYGSAKYSEADKITLVERKGQKITEKLVTSLKDPLMLLELLPADKIKSMMDDNDMDDEDVEEGGSELEEMSRSELKAYIRENELGIKPKKSMSDDDIRDAIMEALDEEEEEEDIAGDDEAFADEEEDDIPYEFAESEEDEEEDEEEEEEEDDEEEDWL